MALTEADIARFAAPSVWGETDCVHWLARCTGLELRHGASWLAEPSEARAMARAVAEHGSYAGAVTAALGAHGWRSIDPRTTPWRDGDVAVLSDPLLGDAIAGVALPVPDDEETPPDYEPTPELVMRHAGGVCPAQGTVVALLRRG